jgi:hypothetical protein
MPLPFWTDLVTVKRSEPRNALQPRAQTPHDFIPGFCSGWSATLLPVAYGVARAKIEPWLPLPVRWWLTCAPFFCHVTNSPWNLSLFASNSPSSSGSSPGPSCPWRIAISLIIPEDFPSCDDSAKRNLVVFFMHFNAFVRLLPASRASGRPPDAHACGQFI